MEDHSLKSGSNPKLPYWIGVAVAAVIVAVFYLLVPGFGPDKTMSPLAWLKSTWISQNQLEHGNFVPVIIVGLIAWQWPVLKQSVGPATWKGVPVLLLGAVLFVISHRTDQPRVAIASLPVILWGGAWFLWGWKVAARCLLPLFLLYLTIPVPKFHLLSSYLQILSTKLAHIEAGWFGVETEVRGTSIYSIGGNWAPLEIDHGCGGNRSLMFLIIIASVWAYVSRLAAWKQCLMILVAVPIEVLCEALRLVSIFVVAEYGDPEFARLAWHDWSGLVLFYPFAVLLFFGTHALLKGGLPKPRNLLTCRRPECISECEGQTVSFTYSSLTVSAIVGIVMSSIFFLPPVAGTSCAVSLGFPSRYGDWQVQAYPPNDKELAILQQDTRFAKARCGLRRWEERSYITGDAPIDVADLSIVLAGRRSIHAVHRPERSMPAQGHVILQQVDSQISLKSGRSIPVKRILSKQYVHGGQEVDCVTYCVFIGHSKVTASHFQRTVFDFADRLFRGEDQQWAHVRASMRFLDQPSPSRGDPLSMDAADKKLRGLFVDLMEHQVDWSQIDD